MLLLLLLLKLLDCASHRRLVLVLVLVHGGGAPPRRRRGGGSGGEPFGRACLQVSVQLVRYLIGGAHAARRHTEFERLGRGGAQRGDGGLGGRVLVGAHRVIQDPLTALHVLLVLHQQPAKALERRLGCIGGAACPHKVHRHAHGQLVGALPLERLTHEMERLPGRGLDESTDLLLDLRHTRCILVAHNLRSTGVGTSKSGVVLFALFVVGERLVRLLQLLEGVFAPRVMTLVRMRQVRQLAPL